MTQLVWTPRALTHFEEMQDFLAQKSPKAAYTVACRIQKALAVLVKYPEMGRPAAQKHVRLLVVPQTQYLLPYRRKKDRIEILDVFHAKREMPKQW